MASSEILYERTDTFFHPISKHLIISISIIETLVYPTDKDGWIIQGEGEIKSIPNYDVLGIRPYKAYMLFKPKRFTGLQVQIKDRRLSLIGFGFMGHEQAAITTALKECIGARWDEIYHTEILLDAQAMRLR
jgi:hypothetical protein